MSCLTNTKHELFAQEIAKGASNRAAYAEAGYKITNDEATDASASRLLSDARVQARVEELKRAAAETTTTTIESLIKEGWDIIKASKEDKQHAAASQTLERLAKIAGLWVDRSDVKTDVTLGGLLDAIDR